MQLIPYTASQYASANKDLLPLGQAWQWPDGGFGDSLIQGESIEFGRLQNTIDGLVEYAPSIHQPAQSSWHISEYRRLANALISNVSEVMPRKTAAIGSTIGTRLWSSNAPATNFAVPLLQIEQLLGPARIGSKIGQALWGNRSRYVMRVRYYRSVVDPKPLWDLLNAFKQAHVFLWFEDITGAGGHVDYAQN